jgi:hypothetical protein
VIEVEIFPLVPGIALPQPAPSRTRDEVPPGYGVQEQCLPFAVAAALGFLIPSPIAFGVCLPEELPTDAHYFRSPVDLANPDGICQEPRLFYVKDDSRCGFFGNAHVLRGKLGYEPGISFFDRPDQLDLFKLHLPYVWRTPANIDTLFLPPINRDLRGLTLICGAVETDWYANPVNLVFRKPGPERSVHVSVGDPIAQAAFLPRDVRRPRLNFVDHSNQAGECFTTQFVEWRMHKSHHPDAYKQLSRKFRHRR